VVRVTRGEGGGPPTVAVGFAGLTGPTGVLPQHYTALLMSRVRQKDYSLRDFLDLFHHRVFSLLYRAWRKRSLALQAEAAGAGREADAGRQVLLSVGGFGPATLARRAPPAAVWAAGLFAHRTRTAGGLRAALSGAVGWPVEVETFAGQWLYLAADDRNRLGGSALGGGLVLGRRVWDRQSLVRVRVGPVDLPTFRALGAGGELRTVVAHLARTYCGADLDIEVRVLLARDEVPVPRLVHKLGDRPRLGRDCWSRTHQLAGPPDDAVFRVV
jgi:type VI secretion system protein ImpH